MNDDTLLREVDEAIRRDRASEAFARHKKTIIAVIIAVIIGTGGGQIYRSQQDKTSVATTHALLEGKQYLSDGDASKAATWFKAAAEDARGESKARLLTWQARAEITAGDTDAARATLASVIKDAAKDSTWRDLACVWSAGLDGALPKACAAASTGPLTGMKQELALADALKARDYDRAAELIAVMEKAEFASPEAKQRLMQMKLLLPPSTDIKDTK